MERIYAFTDEYGAFGWDIDNPTVSTHFVITAILVKESDLLSFQDKAESIRRRHFQTGEIKSKKVGSDHERRQRILSELLTLPFQIFAVSIDKKKCLESMTMHGLLYKGSFYKFMNNIMHKELTRAYRKITVIADETGSNDYMESFCRYFEKNQDIPNLLGDADFQFNNSKQNIGIQIADFISGTIALFYDTHKITADGPDYYSILQPRLIRIEDYPKTYKDFHIEKSAIASDYDADIADICFRAAVSFVLANDKSDDPLIQAQSIVLKYLLFRFMNNDTRGYIYTNELINLLSTATLGRMSVTTFRMNIIGKLRDSGVIIASSEKGYKIPSKRAEIYDYIERHMNNVLPMLSRIKRCRDIILLGTDNEVDILEPEAYTELREIIGQKR